MAKREVSETKAYSESYVRLDMLKTCICWLGREIELERLCSKLE